MAKLEIGERFKDARNVHNQHGKQTMDEVAAATGVSKTVIQSLEKWENRKNNRDVGISNVIALAKHYSVSADWLLGLSEDHNKQPCAADTLGLSENIVNWFTALKENSTPENDLSASICDVMELPRFQALMYQLSDCAHAVKAECLHSQLVDQYIPQAGYASDFIIADEHIGNAITILALSGKHSTQTIAYLSAIHQFADKYSSDTTMARSLFGGQWITPSELSAHRVNTALTLLIEQLREHTQNSFKRSEAKENGHD